MAKAEPFLEYTMSINNIQRPKILKEHDAVYVLLVRLALLDPGQNEAFPEMGLGLRTKYRYALEDKLTEMVSNYQTQIETYIPGISFVDVSAEIKNKHLIFRVNINNEIVYPIVVNVDTFTLSQV